MKIIDRTPYYNEKGNISLADRTRAVLKYGRNWLSEMEAQKSILPVLEKYLDRKFTLLRNVILPGLEASIPLILIGPAGLFVFNVTDLQGIFRAKGDQWGTISGATLKPEKVNLLTRTEQMAQAVQLFLRQEGRLDIPGVESALVFTNPSIHVDAVRPIVRVVLCDALERFIISLSEATPVINQDLALRVVNLITNPMIQKSPDEMQGDQKVLEINQNNYQEIPAEAALATQSTPSATDGNTNPPFDNIPDVPEIRSRDISQPAGIGLLFGGENLETTLFGNKPAEPSSPDMQASDLIPGKSPEPSVISKDESVPWQIPSSIDDFGSQPGMIPLQSEISSEPYSSPLPESLFPGFSKPGNPAPISPGIIKKKPVSRKQWVILACLAIFWLILSGILIFFIIKDLL